MLELVLDDREETVEQERRPGVDTGEKVPRASGPGPSPGSRGTGSIARDSAQAALIWVVNVTDNLRTLPIL